MSLNPNQNQELDDSPLTEEEQAVLQAQEKALDEVIASLHSGNKHMKQQMEVLRNLGGRCS